MNTHKDRKQSAAGIAADRCKHALTTELRIPHQSTKYVCGNGVLGRDNLLRPYGIRRVGLLTTMCGNPGVARMERLPEGQKTKSLSS